MNVTSTTERIRERAYALYLARGQSPGHELEDWYRAERELSEGDGQSGAEQSLRTGPNGSAHKNGVDHDASHQDFDIDGTGIETPELPARARRGRRSS